MSDSIIKVRNTRHRVLIVSKLFQNCLKCYILSSGSKRSHFDNEHLFQITPSGIRAGWFKNLKQILSVEVRLDRHPRTSGDRPHRF